MSDCFQNQLKIVAVAVMLEFVRHQILQNQKSIHPQRQELLEKEIKVFKFSSLSSFFLQIELRLGGAG